MTAAPPPPAPGPTADGTPSPGFDGVAVPPGAPPHDVPGYGAGPGWGPAAPSWSPGPGSWAGHPVEPFRAPARPADGGRGRTALIALAGAVAGAGIAAVVTSLVFLAGARAMGEEIGDRVAEEVGVSGGWSTDPLEDPLPSGPVEQTEPVAPGDLGPDPVLDAYAQQCFDGDLQSCDDLFYGASPGSGYEEYGTSCGGRVEPGAVWACTELD